MIRRVLAVVVVGVLFAVIPHPEVSAQATRTPDEIEQEIADLRARIAELESMLPSREITFSGTGRDLGDETFYLAEGQYRVTARCQNTPIPYFNAVPLPPNESDISLIVLSGDQESDTAVRVFSAGDYLLETECNGAWTLTIAPIDQSS